MRYNSNANMYCDLKYVIILNAIIILSILKYFQAATLYLMA